MFKAYVYYWCHTSRLYAASGYFLQPDHCIRRLGFSSSRANLPIETVQILGTLMLAKSTNLKEFLSISFTSNVPEFTQL